MGTPPSSDLRARSNNALDLGRSSTKRLCSRCMRDCRRLRSIVFMKGAEILAEIVEAGRPRPAVYGCPAVKGYFPLWELHRRLFSSHIPCCGTVIVPILCNEDMNIVASCLTSNPITKCSSLHSPPINVGSFRKQFGRSYLKRAWPEMQRNSDCTEGSSCPITYT